ncbi:hypothetical protein GW17_00029004 [Ensete ventricosum]|nr:hypothetical protein GW17_00029004 [Ensete ventricosum]
MRSAAANKTSVKLGILRERRRCNLECQPRKGDSVRHLHKIMMELMSKVTLLTRTLNAGGSNICAASQQSFKAPEPHCYKGAKDAKELENFLFDKQHYFRAARLDYEEPKVSIAIIYQNGDVKL